MSSHIRAYVILTIGMIAASFAAVFTRLAEYDGVPALVIAAGRLTLGSLMLMPFILKRYSAELRRLSKRDVLFAAAAGAWLALHFILFIKGLEYTTVLVSIVLGATSPLWSAILDMLVLKGRISRPVWMGMGLAFIGVLCIGFAATKADEVGQNTLLGGTLTIVSTIAGSIYMTMGRKVRAHVSIMPYIYLVFSFAALTALIAVAATRTSITGYPPSGYLWILGLAIFPQLIGHTTLNIVFSHFSPTYIGLVGQLQAVMSIIFALLLFHEVPLPLQIIGGLAIIGGVVVATLGQHAKPAPQPLTEPVPVPAGD
jgi:drug/metabolite transporter (DMT)-like permease